MGFLYKQRYAGANVPPEAVPGLNVRHLQYIATRPGALYNRDCGFSLWGVTSARACAEDIQNLDDAKKLIRQESERGRTIYRAVISMGEPEAGEYGFYERSAWERVLNENIQSIAVQMHIPAADVRWLASMHYAEGHPHVHLLFWDAGKQPRQNFLTPERFEKAMEKIRAVLNRSVFGTQINAAREEGKDIMRDARLELRALFRDLNPQAAFSVPGTVKDPRFAALSQELLELLKNVPGTGSLKYQYLPPAFRLRVDTFTRHLRELPCVSKRVQEYLASVRQVCTLYGNGEARTAEELKKAEEKLDRDFGNEVLDALRRLLQELRQDGPQTPAELQACIATYLRRLLSDSPAYAALLESLPRERLPIHVLFAREDCRALRTELIRQLFSDARFRTALYAFAGAKLTPDAPREESRDVQQEVFSAAAQEAGRQLTENIYEDKGWRLEAVQTHAMHLLRSIVRLLAQSSSQQAARGELLRRTKRDLSREAKKDARQKHSLSDAPVHDL